MKGYFYFIAIFISCFLFFPHSVFARRIKKGTTEIEIRPGFIFPTTSPERLVVIFDCDGTITTGKDPLSLQALLNVCDNLKRRVEGESLTEQQKEAIRNLFEENLKTPRTADKIKGYIQVLARDADGEIRRRYEKIMDDPIEVRHFEKSYIEEMKTGLREFITEGHLQYEPGVISLLKALQEIPGIEVVKILLSGTLNEIFQLEADLMGYRNYFDRVLGLGGASDPSLSSKEAVIDELKTEIGDARYIVIGDTTSDFIAAKRAGDDIITICIGEEFLPGADARISNYFDVEKIIKFLLGEYP